jgi:hypothetical protein
VLFFEHEFRNPSAADAVFVVESSSPDLVLVSTSFASTMNVVCERV